MKNKSLTLLFAITIILLSFSEIFSSKTCGHAWLKNKNEKSGKDNKVTKIKAIYEKTDTWKPMRTHVDFSGLISKDPKSDILTQKIKTYVIPRVMKVLAELFRVRRIKSITLNEKICDEYKIPTESYGPKNPIETDLIIFVNFDQTGDYKKNRIEGTAIHCYQDSLTNRPIVGLVTYRDDVKINTIHDQDYLVWLTLHEITHVLIFNEDLYTSFIDKDMNKIPYKNIIHEEKNKYKQPMTYVKTPNVLLQARKHFNCPSLKGVPLEYNGRAAAIGGHWSRKYMNTDYMIGRSHGETLISKITLAFFEDSGWYKVDYSKSSIFFWGKNKGCHFLEKSCIKSTTAIKSLKHSFVELMKKHDTKEESTKKKYRNSVEGELEEGVENMSVTSSVVKVKTNFKEFCEDINQPVCSTHNMFRGYCGVKKYSLVLPRKYQNFPDTKIGGFDVFMHRCPVVIENKQGIKHYGGNCKFGSKKDLLPYEKVSMDSGCFISSLSKELKIPTVKDVEESANNLEIFSVPKIINSKAACIEFICDNGEIFIKIDGKDYLCPSGKIMSVPGYHGEVQCPSKKLMCHKKYKCKFGCTSVQ